MLSLSFFLSYSHPRMNYRNRMITIQPPWASISCASRPRCSASIYPTGSGNTIRIAHARQMAPVQLPAAPRAATSRATLRANAHRIRVAGRDSTRRRHRSARLARNAPIAVRCCWAHRRTVIMADRAAVRAARRRVNMVSMGHHMVVMVMARLVWWAPHVGPPRTWTPHKHRRVSRSEEALHAVFPSTAASCLWRAAVVQAILAVSWGTPIVSLIWAGAAQRSSRSARHTNGEWRGAPFTYLKYRVSNLYHSLADWPTLCWRNAHRPQRRRLRTVCVCCSPSRRKSRVPSRRSPRP